MIITVVVIVAVILYIMYDHHQHRDIIPDRETPQSQPPQPQSQSQPQSQPHPQSQPSPKTSKLLCPECGGENISVAYDGYGTCHCHRCGHEWVTNPDFGRQYPRSPPEHPAKNHPPTTEEFLAKNGPPSSSEPLAGRMPRCPRCGGGDVTSGKDGMIECLVCHYVWS